MLYERVVDMKERVVDQNGRAILKYDSVDVNGRRRIQTRERVDVKQQYSIDAIERTVDAGEPIDAVDHQCYTSVWMKHINAIVSSLSMRTGGEGYM